MVATTAGAKSKEKIKMTYNNRGDEKLQF